MQKPLSDTTGVWDSLEPILRGKGSLTVEQQQIIRAAFLPTAMPAITS